MATTHVFIVDINTFKIHLNYLFAGTGAGNDDIDFNHQSTTTLSYAKENKLAAMSADASRIRQGDKIIFYLQQNKEQGILEGKFYGVFKASRDWSFIERNLPNCYLSVILSKPLIFRTIIEPDIVYPQGLTEWEALDSIIGINSPNQMLWSLIYRKLKGNRGNTMITIYESERLCQQIRNKNGAISLNIINCGLDFNSGNQEITLSNQPIQYTGNQMNVIEVLPRIINKFSRNLAFEAHLQSYIVKNIGLGLNGSLDQTVLGNDFDMEWIGNEVSCGVGMQRIDIAISINRANQRVFIPIELKAVEASVDNVRQVQRYIDWIEQYYIPNRQSDIQPVIIAKEYANKASQQYLDTINSFRGFNNNNARRCLPIKYVEFSLNQNNLIFDNIIY